MFLRVLIVFCAAFLQACRTPATAWKPTKWGGKPAWESHSGDLRAVVSAQSGRLVVLAKGAASPNFLFEPKIAERAYSGGHILWFGPQLDWPVPWPPPTEWGGPPASVEIQGPVLGLEMGRVASDYPPLKRTYEWKHGRMVCGAWWFEATDQPLQAIHLVQIPRTAVVRSAWNSQDSVARIPFEAGQTFQKKIEPSSKIWRKTALQAWVRRDGNQEKLGFKPRKLIAQNQGMDLIMTRGKQEGRVAETTDEGYLTQIFLGADKWKHYFTEIEQLSPCLHLGKNGKAGFAIEMELRPSKNPDAFSTSAPDQVNRHL